MTTTHGAEAGQLAFESAHAAADSDRWVILDTILRSADCDGGAVDPNDVRHRLTHSGALSVDPRRLSGAYSSLVARGILSRRGWTENDDVRGGNGGKPLRTYWLTDRNALTNLMETP